MKIRPGKLALLAVGGLVVFALLYVIFHIYLASFTVEKKINDNRWEVILHNVSGWYPTSVAVVGPNKGGIIRVQTDQPIILEWDSAVRNNSGMNSVSPLDNLLEAPSNYLGRGLRSLFGIERSQVLINDEFYRDNFPPGTPIWVRVAADTQLKVVANVVITTSPN